MQKVHNLSAVLVLTTIVIWLYNNTLLKASEVSGTLGGHEAHYHPKTSLHCWGAHYNIYVTKHHDIGTPTTT